MKIKIVNNNAAILKELKNKEKQALDTNPVLRIIKVDMKKEAQMRFRTQKGPDGEEWAPLSETTKELRRGSVHIPLSDTGGLKRSLTSKNTSKYAVVGTNKEYAAFQNFPVKKGESGTSKVLETVRAHTRNRKGKMENVKEHKRNREVATPWGDKPGRPFLGFSKEQIIKYIELINKHFGGE